MTQATQNSRVIKASPETIYQAFAHPEALETWLVPGTMIGNVHRLDFREGGGYEMSLFYPPSEKEMKGKTSEKEDRYWARFVQLIPSQKIVQAIRFDTTDPDFAGEMIMEVRLEPVANGTNVTFLFRNLPAGIRPEDNEAGTISSLEKLAHYVE